MSEGAAGAGGVGSSSSSAPGLQLHALRHRAAAAGPAHPPLQLAGSGLDGAGFTGAGAVELACARQFDRSGSFHASTGGWADDDDDDDSSSSSTSSSGSPEGGSLGSWGGGGGSAAVFEAFAVEAGCSTTELAVLKEAYRKKERECEHLRQIMRELSISRSKAHKTKVQLEEQLGALQKDYCRVVKVSELARTVSQQAVSRASSLKTELAASSDQLRRSRRRASALAEQNAALAEQNAALQQRLQLLEQLRFNADDCRTSACARAYLFTTAASLY